MKMKMSSTCLAVVLFLSISTVYCMVGEPTNCLAIAENSHGLMGGWHQVPDADLASVTPVVLVGLEEFNKASNDGRMFELAHGLEDSVTKAYSQVVAGTNYCVQYEIKAAGCKNNKGAWCTTGTKTCVGKFFKPLPFMTQGAPAAISVTKLACTDIHEKAKKESRETNRT